MICFSQWAQSSQLYGAPVFLLFSISGVAGCPWVQNDFPDSEFGESFAHLFSLCGHGNGKIAVVITISLRR
jgi:hypothetical protein